MRALAAALFLVTACGETPPSPETPAPPAPRVIPAGGPPSVPVLQARPGAVVGLGWLTDRLVYARDDSRLYVWDVASGRVLFLGEIGAAIEPLSLHGNRLIVPGGAMGGGRELVLERGELEPVTGEILSSDPEIYGEAARDTPEAGTELILHHHGETAALRVPMTPGVRLSFSGDGRTLMACHGDRVRFHDAATGAVRAELSLPSISYCSWPEALGPILVVADQTLHTLDPDTLVEVGVPIAHVRHAHVSPDGRRLAIASLGSREGVTVIERASGRELLHVSRGAPAAVRIVGDIVVGRSVGEDGTAYALTDRPEGTVLADGVGVGTEQVGPNGLLVVEDGIITVRTASGDTIARYDHPATARLEHDGERAGLLAHVEGASFWVSDGDRGAYGVCPPERNEFGAIPAIARRVGARRYLVWPSCTAADDGRVLHDASPLTSTADGAVSVWLEDGHLVIHDRDARRPVVLDEDETQPCHDPRCPLPLAVSEDGAWLAFVRGARLRLFDVATGRVVAERDVADRTLDLAFLASGSLFHRSAGDVGAMQVLAVPRLRELAYVPWESGLLHRDTVISGNWAVDVVGTEARFVDGRGRRHTVTVPRGASVGLSAHHAWVTLASGTAVLSLPTFAEVGRTEGSFRSAAGDDAFLCRAGRLVRARVEGEAVVAIESDAPCPFAVLPFADGWIIDGSLLRADGRVLPLLAVRYGDRVVLGGQDGTQTVGPMRWMLRSPGLTAEGMIEHPAALPSIEAWLADR